MNLSRIQTDGTSVRPLKVTLILLFYYSTQKLNLQSTLCSEKTPTHIFFHISMNYVDLNKNCSEYTHGLIDSDNAKIRYSLRSMT